VNAVSDALHFATHATEICLVVQAGRTSVKRRATRAYRLRIARAKDIGIVLNRIAATRYNPYGYNFRQKETPEGIEAAK